MDSSWKVKCAIDTAKAVVPFQRELRGLKDRVIGYRRDPEKDSHTIRNGLEILEWLGNVTHASVLEVGTGWQPMIPILFSLAGARVYMADLHNLMRRDTFGAALEALRRNCDEIVQRLKVTPDAVNHATRQCVSMEERLQELRLTYLAPCDCRRLPFNTGSVDIVTSRAVLEHVPPSFVAGIFCEANRVLAPNGRMLHIVDHSDHWSHRDSSISAVNFLRYPNWLFRLTCLNPQNYQNRLRHSEYLDMLKRNGFRLKREQRNVDPRCVAALSKIRIAERFRQNSVEDLATTSSILLAEREPSLIGEHAAGC